MSENKHYDEAGWTSFEREIWRNAKGIARAKGEEEPSITLCTAYLTLTREVWLRNHSPESKKLYKSRYMVRVLQYMANLHLFPYDETSSGSLMRDARLDLLFLIWGHSKQRPVAEAAALACLELEQREHWTEDPTRRERLIEVEEQSHEKVLPGFALISGLSDSLATQKQQELAAQTIQSRRRRIDELVDLFAVFEGEAENLQVLSHTTLEAIFRDTTEEQRWPLFRRLFEGLNSKWSVEGHRRWRYILDPLIAQNPSSDAFVRFVMDLGRKNHTPVLEPYLLAHFRATHPKDITWHVLKHAERHGTKRSLPYLFAIRKIHSNWFVGWASRKEATQEAIDAIMEREGLDESNWQVMAGGLSFHEAHEEDGMLSLTQGPFEGALTLPVEDTHIALIEEQAPTPIPKGMLLFLAVVVALVVLLGAFWFG